MATFHDLTPYTYLAEHSLPPGSGPMLNVGWLGTELEFRRGETDPEIVEILASLVGEAKHLTRGYHRCEFCDAPPSGGRARLGLHQQVPTRDGSVVLGSAEIHVTGEDGTVYSAPNMIIHYIIEHGYRPPDEFQQAVLYGARSES